LAPDITPGSGGILIYKFIITPTTTVMQC